MQFSSALVTGASSGIGEALAELLASKKINLILCGRRKDRLAELAKRLSREVAVEIIAADLADKTGRAELVSCIRHAVPDLVINCAGFGVYGPALEHSVDEELGILEVNAVALTELTLEAGRALIAAGRKGVVLNVSSAAAFIPMPNLALYGASKAFVNALSVNLDLEWRPLGVRVLASCPGMVKTRFRERAAKGHPQESSGGALSKEYVARQIWRQIRFKKSILIIDWRYRLGIRLSKRLPRALLGRLIVRNIDHRISH